jgi:site-specific recombinase XerD
VSQTPWVTDEAEPLLAEHLQDLGLANQRPRSIRERRYAVLRAARSVGHPLVTVTSAELAAWQRGLAVTPAGMHNETVHVRQYLRWCAERGHRAEDPSAVLIRPKTAARLPRPLGDADIHKAMLSADQPMRAWIALAAFCGLRCMEIANLSREDVIEFDTPFLRVVGKGDKERIVPLPAAVLAELHAAGMPNRGYLWERMDGGAGPPTAGRVSERINDHLQRAGIAGTAHQLRHRFGTKLYAATKDLMLVATAMGHSSTETTKGYVLLNPHAASAGIEEISRLSR